jgi:hypothetical protein
MRYLIIFLLLTAPTHAEDNPVLKMSLEPTSLLDHGIFKIRNKIQMSFRDEEARISRRYKAIKYEADTVLTDRVSIVKLQRRFYAQPNISTCAIAIETLKEHLFKPVDNNLIKYFWHEGASSAPDWVLSMKQHIYLEGVIFDGHEHINCHQRLDQDDINVGSYLF